MESFPPQPNHFTWATCYSSCYCYAAVLPLCSVLYNTFHSVDPATLLHVAFCQLLFCCIFHSGVILRCIFLIGQAATLLHILLRVATVFQHTASDAVTGAQATFLQPLLQWNCGFEKRASKKPLNPVSATTRATLHQSNSTILKTEYICWKSGPCNLNLQQF